MDKDWFKQMQRQHGLTSFDIAVALDRDRTVVSRIYNSKQKMTADQAQVFATLFDVSPQKVLRRAGLLAEPPRSGGTALSESDAAVWVPSSAAVDDKNKKILAAMGYAPEKHHIWQVKSKAMALAGYIEGDLFAVDPSAPYNAKAGDIVIAQIYDWTAGSANTVLRRFDQPALCAASADPEDWKVHIVDNNNVVIKGIAVASWRPNPNRTEAR